MRHAALGRKEETAPQRSDEELVEMLFAVLTPIKRHFAETAGELELSPQQALALRDLDHPRSMRELADRLVCDASNVTGIVDRLEARGLVERQVRPEDRRVKQLLLTDVGRDVVERHHRLMFADVPLLSDMDDDDRRALGNLLQRMLSSRG